MAPHRHDPPEVPPMYAWHQGASLRAIGSTFAHDAFNKLPWVSSGSRPVPPVTPGPLIHEVLPAREDALIDEYVAWSGASSTEYVSTVPPHFFFQWCFPAMQKVCHVLPSSLASMLVQGCSMEPRHPIPRGQELHVIACLREVVTEPGKIKITLAIETGVDVHRDAIVAEVYLSIPQKSKKRDTGNPALGDRASMTKADFPVVASSASIIAAHSLSRRCGLDYAYVSGDFNPIHCSVAVARISGFSSTILQGFGQLALVFEDLVRAECGGDPGRLGMLDIRFVGNVLLPREIFVSVDRVTRRVMEGDKPGGRAALLGSYEINRGPIPKL